MKRIGILGLVALLLLAPLCAWADEAPYQGYIYRAQDDSYVETLNAYLPRINYYGSDLGVGSLKGAQDLYVAKDGKIYVLDTQRNRVVVLNSDFSLCRVIDTFPGGSVDTLKGAQGIFVNAAGEILIADQGNARVIVCAPDGVVQKELIQPDTDLLDSTYIHKPAKVVQDQYGRVFVLCRNLYLGAMTYENDGSFLGFFGNNQVSQSSANWIDKLLKRVMNKTAKSKMERYVPVEFTNFDIDTDGFLYTCSLDTSGGTGDTKTIRKLNAMGTNLLELFASSSAVSQYGDLQTTFDASTQEANVAVMRDVTVDENGFIFALDNNTGRIFGYDQESDILFIVGARGDQLGAFRDTSAVDTLGRELLVLDPVKGCITVLSPTEFGTCIYDAVLLFRDGLYDEAIVPWQRVRAMCENYLLAHEGIGKAQYQNGDYTQAMTSFRLARNQKEYSKAFEQYRRQIMKEYALPILLAVVALLVGLFYLLSRKQKISREDSPLVRAKGTMVLYCLGHPLDGFERVRFQNMGSLPIAFSIIVAYVAVRLLSDTCTAFIFNDNVLTTYDYALAMMQTVLVILTFIISNWAFTTLMEGKGRVRDITVAIAYSLLPLLIAEVAAMLLSHLLIMDEGFILTMIRTAGVIYTGILLTCALYSVHEYTFKKTVFSMLLSLLGMLIIVFLLTMGLSLFTQVFDFIKGIVWELRFRM